MFMTDSQSHIDHTQNRKDEGLNNRDQGPQDVEEDRDHYLSQLHKRFQNLVIAEHVAIEPDRKRNRPKEMGKPLQDKKEGDREKQNRNEEHPQNLIAAGG